MLVPSADLTFAPAPQQVIHTNVCPQRPPRFIVACGRAIFSSNLRPGRLGAPPEAYSREAPRDQIRHDIILFAAIGAKHPSAGG